MFGKKKPEIQKTDVIESEKQAAKASAPSKIEESGAGYELVKVPVQFGVGIQNKETGDVFSDAEIMLHICNEIAEIKKMIIQASK
jgi:hypothetical protein